MKPLKLPDGCKSNKMIVLFEVSAMCPFLSPPHLPPPQLPVKPISRALHEPKCLFMNLRDGLLSAFLFACHMSSAIISYNNHNDIYQN